MSVWVDRHALMMTGLKEMKDIKEIAGLPAIFPQVIMTAEDVGLMREGGWYW